jgi:hypothetical protein
VITKRNQSVAVLVSNEYFEKTQTSMEPNVTSFYETLLEFRRAHALNDDSGFETTPRADGWNRPNPLLTLKASFNFIKYGPSYIFSRYERFVRVCQ